MKLILNEILIFLYMYKQLYKHKQNAYFPYIIEPNLWQFNSIFGHINITNLHIWQLPDVLIWDPIKQYESAVKHAIIAIHVQKLLLFFTFL